MKTVLVDAIGTYVIKGVGVYEPLHTLLESYPNRKIVLTLADAEKMKTFGLDTLEYEVFTTNFDPMKTDSLYYKKVLETYNLTIDDVVYVEHSKAAVETAQSIGIPSYFYDEDIKDVGAVKEFLDSNLNN